jgi:hypothetical protein
VELNYDITNGATRVFINGKQLGDTQTDTGTRDSSIGLLRLGADVSASSIVANALFSDLLVFDAVQHTEDFEYFEYQKKDTTIGRLEYLEGQTVQVLGDGNDLGTFTVTSGVITLEDSYDTVIVGLPYDFEVELHPPEAGSGVGSAQGRPKRIDTLTGRFHRTAQCSFGRDSTNQEEINFREPDAVMDDPIVLFTGDKILPFEGAYNQDSRMVLTGGSPLPCEITCLVARGVTYD